jgi:hypothetical protein
MFDHGQDLDDDYREEIVTGKGALTRNQNRRDETKDPHFSGLLMHGPQRIFVSAWIMDDGKLVIRSRDFEDRAAKYRTKANGNV